MNSLDSVDKLILEAVQSGFPVCERPFLKIAESIGISEERLIERIKTLKENRIIRRFGAVFDSRKLGYLSTLVAVRIPEAGRIPAVAAEINRFIEVTHNYQRENRFNLWFTIIAESRKRIQEIISRVESIDGVAEVRDLPADEMYKIKVDFRTAQ
mgnify:CR=1 FL=1